MTVTGISHDERSADSALSPITITVKETARLSGLGLTSVWQLIRDGKLTVIRVSGRTLVEFASLQRLLTPYPDTQPAPRQTPKRRKSALRASAAGATV